MSLPSSLLSSFDELKRTPLVYSSLISQSSCRQFASILNRAIPSPRNVQDYSIYRFNRLKYLSDKPRFIGDIKGFSPYEALILWTNYEDILAYFGLSGKIFLGWNKRNHRYRAFEFAPTVSGSPIVITDDNCFTPIKYSMSDENTDNELDSDRCSSSRGSTGSVVLDNDEMVVRMDMDDEMDRLYEHMRKRLEIAQKQISGSWV